MNPTVHAVRIGLHRGYTEFLNSIKSTQDQGFYVFTALFALGYLFLRRNSEVEGTDLLYPTIALPSILAALVVFGVVIGPAYALAMEREDGTLLRFKAAPNGLIGYFSGQLLYQSLNIVPQLLTILIPSYLLFDNVMSNGWVGWVTIVWVLALGLVATMPLGMIIGAVVPNTQKVGSWGMMPVMILAGISGIFYPIQMLWTWVQWVAQVFPMYWLGIGMRSAFLPDEAASLELTGTWRTLETILVLGAWAIVGMVVTPIILRRMAKRQSGSTVEAAKQTANQWVH
jgi:ABC-2 type transport system permease protein